MALLKVFFDTFTPLFDLNSSFVEQTKHVLVIESRRAPVTAGCPERCGSIRQWFSLSRPTSHLEGLVNRFLYCV